jgi:hypothetical protein
MYYANVQATFITKKTHRDKGSEILPIQKAYHGLHLPLPWNTILVGLGHVSLRRRDVCLFQRG